MKRETTAPLRINDPRAQARMRQDFSGTPVPGILVGNADCSCFWDSHYPRAIVLHDPDCKTHDGCLHESSSKHCPPDCICNCRACWERVLEPDGDS